MPKITLSYFSFPGRGELSRLLFVYGGVDFENHIVTNFGAFRLKCPFRQVPILEVDGKIFCQSGAIQRYAAKLSGLYPEDPVEALHADMVSETLAEVLNEFYGVFHTRDPRAKAEMLRYFRDETVPKYFSGLEGMVQGKYFAGDKVSFADIHLFDIVHNSINTSLPNFSLEAYPKQLAIVAAIKEHPNVAAYLAE